MGKKNLEVRPIVINKGEMVKRLLSIYTSADFIFCAGDDRTDEDMFKALRKHNKDFTFTCTIGSSTKKTQALSHVTRSEDLIDVLHNLSVTERPNGYAGA